MLRYPCRSNASLTNGSTGYNPRAANFLLYEKLYGFARRSFVCLTLKEPEDCIFITTN